MTEEERALIERAAKAAEGIADRLDAAESAIATMKADLARVKQGARTRASYLVLGVGMLVPLASIVGAVFFFHKEALDPARSILLAVSLGFGYGLIRAGDRMLMPLDVLERIDIARANSRTQRSSSTSAQLKVLEAGTKAVEVGAKAALDAANFARSASRQDE